jgi:hypothetical protein
MPKVVEETSQAAPASVEPRQLQIFICYSHRDERWRERLRVHLRPLERRFDMVVWSDKKILPGEKWKKEIKAAIARADIAILLISADFMASDFISTHELPPLLSQAVQKGTTIVPLVISPSLFDDPSVSELADFQAVNDASKPLLSLAEGEQETQFLNVAKTILAASTKVKVEPARATLAEEVQAQPSTLVEARPGQESFLAPSDWLGLMKIGNWIFDGDNQRIIGSTPKTFLLSQNDYGEAPFTVEATLSFSNFVTPAEKKLGMNAGIVLGWNTRKELVVPYYYNILLTGSDLLMELNGPHASDGRRWQHLTKPVPLPITAEVPLKFRIRVSGQRLSVDVDGKKLIDEPNLAGMTGRVGLRPWRSQLECTKFVVAEDGPKSSGKA